MRMQDHLPEWLVSYQRSWLTNDLVAGATTWALLVPLSLSIAAIAGVAPVVGLYSLPLALVGYAVFGGQRVLVMGPDAAVAILSGSIVASIAIGGEGFLTLTIILALLVGAIYVLFSFLRMGWTADLVADPVLKGFTEGIIWLTILKQSVMLFGLDPDGKPAEIWDYLAYLRQAVFQAHVPTIIVGGLSIAMLVLLRVFRPRWPGALIVLAGSIAVAGVVGLPFFGIAVLGPVEGGLPIFALPPHLAADQIMTLMSGALAIVVLSFTKALPPLQRAAAHSGDGLNPNRELLALGAANIGAALGGGHAVSASLTGTTINIGAGGKTQVGNLFAGLLCIVTIAVLLPLLHNLPLSTLAAIIVVALSGVSNLGYFRQLFEVSRFEFWIAVAAFVGVLLFGVLEGVLIGVVLTLFKLGHLIHEPVMTAVGRTASGGFVDLDEHPDAVAIPGMLILHHYGPVVFLNARLLADALRKATLDNQDIRVVVFDATASSAVDTSAADRIASVRDELAARGVDLWVTNPRRKGRATLEAFLKKQQAALPRMFDTVQDAVAFFESARGSDKAQKTIKIQSRKSAEL